MTPLSFKEWMTHHPGECIEHYMGLHDSLFEAGRYDMLTDIYSGMFLYMPSDPDGNPDTPVSYTHLTLPTIYSV